MSGKEEELLHRLLATFKVEAAERVQAVSTGLVALEKTRSGGRRADLAEGLMREAHSLKGAARAVNLAEVEAICQPMETILAGLKRGDLAWSRKLFDLLHRAADELAALVAQPGQELHPEERRSVGDLVQRLAQAGSPRGTSMKRAQPIPARRTSRVRSQTEAAPTAALAAERPAGVETPRTSPETVRIAAAKLDALLIQAQELIGPKLAAGQRVSDLRDLQARLAGWKTEWTRVAHEVQIDRVLSFLEWTASYLKDLESRMSALSQAAAQDQRALGRMVDDLLEDVKKAVMLPFSRLFEGFPKLVRDLSRDQGKEAELMIRGGEVEIDKRILEEMKDPLIHLIRNCVDHGIERPEERAQKGKPSQGVVTIEVETKNSSQVQVRVADDGSGMNLEQITSAALKAGMVSAEDLQVLDRGERLGLAFRSGLTTSPTITDLSGRGLGLAIVRERVEKLGGSVSLETRENAGTEVRATLPLSLATFRGVLVRVDDRYFVLPTLNVGRTLRVAKAEIKTVENHETIQLDGRTLPLVDLAALLEIPPTHPGEPIADPERVVLLTASGRTMAIRVDEILWEQEVLVKRLGSRLGKVRHVAGATVLESGAVVPVLNVSELLTTAVTSPSRAALAPSAVPAEADRRGSVLVVEDSITARMLLKNILEAAGYAVATAVDGRDALTKLRGEEYDLVVSDVEMPRMDGFDLTAQIRADARLAELPVVLVTARETNEDRERGMEVGANAYIVKSSFDQSNLLEVLRRLV
jgi:two-component system chemotaxis sensor kinase CheA